MPRKAIGERADHDGRKAEERHNGFKVGKVHWCYPFSVSTKTWSIKSQLSSSAHVLHACCNEIIEALGEGLFLRGRPPCHLFSKNLLWDHPN
jgi:hypothetical protein